MSEREWQDQVIDLMHVFGWRVAHFRPAKTERGWRTPVQADGQGFPDLIAARGNRLLAVELKAEKGKLSPQQAVWVESFAQTPAEVYVWRPSEFETVHRILRSQTRPDLESTEKAQETFPRGRDK